MPFSFPQRKSFCTIIYSTCPLEAFLAHLLFDETVSQKKVLMLLVEPQDFFLDGWVFQFLLLNALFFINRFIAIDDPGDIYMRQMRVVEVWLQTKIIEELFFMLIRCETGCVKVRVAEN